MDFMNQDVLYFFDQHQTLLPLYEAFAEKIAEQFPDTKMRVQKTQITFSNRHVYACISFMRVKKKAELPDSYFVLTLGLPYPLESGRVAVKTEPYPGRWTTHIVISDMIRAFEENDLTAVMQIWLDTNMKAHYFIPKEYRTDNYEMVRSK